MGGFMSKIFTKGYKVNEPGSRHSTPEKIDGTSERDLNKHEPQIQSERSSQADGITTASEVSQEASKLNAELPTDIVQREVYLESTPEISPLTSATETPKESPLQSPQTPSEQTVAPVTGPPKELPQVPRSVQEPVPEASPNQSPETPIHEGPGDSPISKEHASVPLATSSPEQSPETPVAEPPKESFIQEPAQEEKFTSRSDLIITNIAPPTSVLTQTSPVNIIDKPLIVQQKETVPPPSEDILQPQQVQEVAAPPKFIETVAEEVKLSSPVQDLPAENEAPKKDQGSEIEPAKEIVKEVIELAQEALLSKDYLQGAIAASEAPKDLPAEVELAKVEPQQPVQESTPQPEPSYAQDSSELTESAREEAQQPPPLPASEPPTQQTVSDLPERAYEKDEPQEQPSQPVEVPATLLQFTQQLINSSEPEGDLPQSNSIVVDEKPQETPLVQIDLITTEKQSAQPVTPEALDQALENLQESSYSFIQLSEVEQSSVSEQRTEVSTSEISIASLGTITLETPPPSPANEASDSTQENEQVASGQQQPKDIEGAVVKIQAGVRGYLTRKALQENLKHVVEDASADEQAVVITQSPVSPEENTAQTTDESHQPDLPVYVAVCPPAPVYPEEPKSPELNGTSQKTAHAIQPVQKFVEKEPETLVSHCEITLQKHKSETSEVNTNGQSTTEQSSADDSAAESAAIRIQSTYRGYSVRKQLKEKTDTSADVSDSQQEATAEGDFSITTNSTADESLVIIDSTENFDDEQENGDANPELAATRIQAAFRGYRVRRELKPDNGPSVHGKESEVKSNSHDENNLESHQAPGQLVSTVEAK